MLEETEVMTIGEVAEYLKMGKRSIYKLAQTGKIPAKMILNKWRFSRTAIRLWILKK